ncbi:hypothetical protein PRIPAC_84827, partial [Pristionchus pacificus]|uniref:Uncharacterized protein n=1 Tax=Pristionchus pacificus TaxID=54126 RepID=A0A2A6BRR1_PRIPA
MVGRNLIVTSSFEDAPYIFSVTDIQQCFGRFTKNIILRMGTGDEKIYNITINNVVNAPRNVNAYVKRFWIDVESTGWGTDYAGIGLKNVGRLKNKERGPTRTNKNHGPTNAVGCFGPLGRRHPTASRRVDLVSTTPFA